MRLKGIAMKRTLPYVLIGTLGLGLFLLWNRKVEQYKPVESVLLVGTSADFPPFSFHDMEDNIVGFDIDVIKEIARRMSLAVDIQDKPFNTLLPQLQLGQIHVIAAGMTPSQQRAQEVNFTQTYLAGSPLLIVALAKHPEIKSLEDIKGKEVLVNAGYTADTYMSQFPEINLVRLPKITDAFAALEQGKGIAFITAADTIEPYFKTTDKTKFRTIAIPGTNEPVALALSKKLPTQVSTQINQIISDMISDGTMKQLKEKWNLL